MSSALFRARTRHGLLFAGCLWLIVLPAAVRAQSRVEAAPGKASVQSRRAGPLDFGNYFLASNSPTGIDDDSDLIQAGAFGVATSDAETPQPLSSVEAPPEPAWSTWNPNSDLATPASPYVEDYLLVRPAHGVGQELDDQTYIGRVTSPDDLDYHLRTNPPPLDPYRPDTMAPSGIFNANMLSAGGQLLISYRFTDSYYRGNLDGTSGVSSGTILNQFTLAPTKMRALTHNILIQYAPTDDLNIQAILPIMERTINFVDRFGNTSATHITDLTDIPITAMYVLRRWNCQQLNLNMGIRIPTGIFDTLSQQQQGLPTPNSPALTYPMRTSDGTYDMLPGLTYLGQSDDWTWGGQTSGTLRFGLNRYGYRLGQQFDATAWIARRLGERFSASCRLDGQAWGNIHRADTRLNQALVETNVPGLQAGQTLNLLFGVNSYFQTVGPFDGRYGQFFSFEMGLPVYQNLSGPQLQQRFVLFANWNLTF